MSQKHSTLLRASGVLSALLAVGLFWVAGFALLFAGMGFTASGPGGQNSVVTREDIQFGVQALLVSILAATAGVFCVVWTVKTWRKPKHVLSAK